MGLNLSLSLSAPSCFPSEAENGSLVTNMASGHWVMRSLFSLPCATKGPFVPLPAPLSGSSLPPTHPKSLLPTPPALLCAHPWAVRSDRGLAVVSSLSQGALGGERALAARDGHFENIPSRLRVRNSSAAARTGEATPGEPGAQVDVLWPTFCLQAETGPSSPELPAQIVLSALRYDTLQPQPS